MRNETPDWLPTSAHTHASAVCSLCVVLYMSLVPVLIIVYMYTCDRLHVLEDFQSRICPIVHFWSNLCILSREIVNNSSDVFLLFSCRRKAQKLEEEMVYFVR